MLVGQPAQEANRILSDMVSEKGIVGLAAGFAVDGEVVWSNASGYRCREQQLPFTVGTCTRTASTAKPMTAVAVMQLVERGLVDLDQSVQAYLPDFPTKEKGVITVRQLLAHTSGIPQYQNAGEAENTHYYATLEEAISVFADRPLLFDPGTRFFYTTYGYVLLGRVIEEVTGLTYEQYMDAYIWQRAGMENTGVERKSETDEKRSCLYHKKKKKARKAKHNDLSNRVPGGGLYTTLPDMLNFGNALLQGKLLQESTLQQMLINQFEAVEGNPYGLGWFLYGPPPNENLVVGHGGEQTGAATQLMIIPKSATVVAVLANTSGTWKEVVTLSSELVRISEEDGR
jgi:CubicO group peptidase (beta-lactamase class C family)